MNAADLIALAERCETAERADRGIDIRIWCALNGKEFPEPPYEAMTPDYDADASGETLTMSVTRNGLLRQSFADQAPKFTTSLDAAMTLVPEGWDPQICKGPSFCLSATDTCPWGVSLIGNPRDIEGEYGPELAYDSHDANAATAALALTAAALRARACDSGRQPKAEDPLAGLSGEAMPERPPEEEASPNLSPNQSEGNHP